MTYKVPKGIVRKYGLQTKVKKIILNRTFDTPQEAKEWGDWNDKGLGIYDVIVIEEGILTPHNGI